MDMGPKFLRTSQPPTHPMEKGHVMSRSKILVDGNCIVCDWEISKYARAAPDAFELVDISAPDFDAERYGLTPKAVNRRMHVLPPDDRVLTGVAAFAHIWSHIPAMRWASRVVALPGIAQLATVGYEAFAWLRPWLPKKRPRHAEQ